MAGLDHVQSESSLKGEIDQENIQGRNIVEHEVGAQQNEDDVEVQNSRESRARPKYNSTGLSANIEAIKELEAERMNSQSNVL